MSVDRRVLELQDQLRAHPYDVAAGEFVRFRVDANDDVIAGIVRAASSAGDKDVEAFRHGLAEDETNALRLFAMRRTLQGRRQASLGLLSEAMDGYALLSKINDVPWDSWLEATLFIVRSLGGDLTMAAERFADVTDRAMSARCDVAVEAMQRVDDLAQCRIAEVTTNYGTGFVEILVFRNVPTFGLFGAPTRLGVNQIEYCPTTNLAQLAASVADALDNSGTVVTSPLGQDQLAATSFARIVAGSYLPTLGCLSFVADRVDGRESFTVFVAELPDDADITELVAGAASIGGQAVVHDARRLILLSPQPSFDDKADDDGEIDFGDYEDLVRTVLADPATASWKPR